MKQPSAVELEALRLEALRACAVSEGPADPRFADLALLASAAMGLPHAMIAVLEEDREITLASVGFEAGDTPRESSLGDAILHDPSPLFSVEDASLDPRFASHPFVVGEPGVRMIAAAPLGLSEGGCLGVLAVFDSQPGQLDARGRQLLPLLAGRVMDLLELHRAAAELGHARAHLDSLSTLIPMCSHCRKVRNEDNVWQTLERLVQAKTGSRFTHGICPDCVRERYPDRAEELLRGSSRRRARRRGPTRS